MGLEYAVILSRVNRCSHFLNERISNIPKLKERHGGTLLNKDLISSPQLNESLSGSLKHSDIFGGIQNKTREMGGVHNSMIGSEGTPN